MNAKRAVWLPAARHENGKRLRTGVTTSVLLLIRRLRGSRVSTCGRNTTSAVLLRPAHTARRSDTLSEPVKLVLCGPGSFHCRKLDRVRGLIARNIDVLLGAFRQASAESSPVGALKDLLSFSLGLCTR